MPSDYCDDDKITAHDTEGVVLRCSVDLKSIDIFVLYMYLQIIDLNCV